MVNSRWNLIISGKFIGKDEKKKDSEFRGLTYVNMLILVWLW